MSARGRQDRGHDRASRGICRLDWNGAVTSTETERGGRPGFITTLTSWLIGFLLPNDADGENRRQGSLGDLSSTMLPSGSLFGTLYVGSRRAAIRDQKP